ncbi:MAG: HAMP domain-containing histidine kinase [Oscillospiraceae bacterium]|nr:HAMP domain-containing histidine kinase [Oscillospiraceae bacterium]
MFKSIFIKYILAFLAIITISFTILAGIISARVIQYSINAEQMSMATAASFAKQSIEKNFNNSNIDKFDDFIIDVRDSLPNELVGYANLVENSLILITDLNGTIVLAAPPAANYMKKEYISQQLMSQLLQNQEIQRFQTLDGVFYSKHLIFTQTLNSKDGSICGVLFFCSASVGGTNSFIYQIISAIILSCLWILVATMVIIYFITEKIISPVRTMSKAAKSFALGHFDVRVPVIGRDEVAELAVAFNNMASSLSIIDEKQRAFVANVSHDLRSPMQNIAGYINGILDGTIPEEQHEYYLNIVSAETERLGTFVESLFNLTKIQSGETKLNKKNFDVCETARLSLIFLEHAIEAKHIEPELLFDSEKMYVYADPDNIRRVLNNLLENAIKFTPEKGIIRINIQDKEKKVYVSVYNTGIGISKEDIPFVFDRFFKADRSRGLDKTGAG